MTNDVLLHLSFPSQPKRLSSIPPSIRSHVEQAVALLHPHTPHLRIQVSNLLRSANFDHVKNLVAFLYSAPINALHERHGSDRSMQMSMGIDVVVDGLHGASFKDSAQFRHVLQHDISTSELQDPVGEHTINPRFDVIALGGTFDHLHSGHKILLTMAAWLASGSENSYLIVGITDDVLLQKKSNLALLQPLSLRCDTVHAFFSLIAPNLRISTPPLIDIYGPTATEPYVQALILTAETRASGPMINAERRKRGLEELIIWEIEVIGATGMDVDNDVDDHEMKKLKMGSSAIREWLREKGDDKVC